MQFHKSAVRPGLVGREELDSAQCQQPGCTSSHGALALVPKCHRGSGVRAAYLPGSGELNLACATCGEPVAAVRVGFGSAPAPGVN